MYLVCKLKTFYFGCPDGLDQSINAWPVYVSAPPWGGESSTLSAYEASTPSERFSRILFSSILLHVGRVVEGIV